MKSNLFKLIGIVGVMAVFACDKKEGPIQIEVKNSCHDKPSKQLDKQEKVNVVSQIIQPHEVVLIVPTSNQLDSLQQEMDEEEYHSFIDDSSFYVQQAKEYFEQIHFSVVEVESGKTIDCITEKGKHYPFSTRNRIWEIVVFNGVTTPEVIDITQVRTETERVYAKK